MSVPASQPDANASSSPKGLDEKERLEVSTSRGETAAVRNVLERLMFAQEEERHRVALDVHDQLGQPMTALRMQMEVLSARSAAHPALLAEVKRAMQLAEELDRSIDSLTWELRPVALDHLGLSTALEDLVHAWSARFHMAGEYHSHGTDRGSLRPDVAINLYRIVQEALHNVQKHARATHVSVRFAMHEADAVIVIEDDGQGFTPAALEATLHHGLGLVSMRERARLIGGEITIQAALGRGTSIFVTVPVNDRVQNAHER